MLTSEYVRKSVIFTKNISYKHLCVRFGDDTISETIGGLELFFVEICGDILASLIDVVSKCKIIVNINICVTCNIALALRNDFVTSWNLLVLEMRFADNENLCQMETIYTVLFI